MLVGVEAGSPSARRFGTHDFRYEVVGVICAVSWCGGMKGAGLWDGGFRDLSWCSVMDPEVDAPGS